jgi:hypothetical protein
LWGFSPVGGDTPETLCTAVGKRVHGLLGEIESIGTGIHGSDIDGCALIFKAVALSTVGAVPAGDAEGSANIGEGWERPGGGVRGHEAILAVRAGRREHIKTRVVVFGLEGDGELRCGELGDGSQREGQEGDECELHFACGLNVDF